MFRGRKVGGKRNTDNVNNFHRDDYIKTMKQLQMETRGLLADSPEYLNIRNKLFREMGYRKTMTDQE